MLYITDKGHMNEIPEDVSEGDRVVVFCKETDSIRVLDMGRLLAAARLVPVEFVPADTKDEMLLAIGGMRNPMNFARDYVINSTRNVPREDVNAAAIRVMLDWRTDMELAKEHGMALERFADAKVKYHDHAERIKHWLAKDGLREDER